MNKKQLITYLAQNADMSRASAVEALETVVRGIVQGMEDDGIVTLIGLGTFHATHRRERIGVDPRNQQKVVVPEMMIPRFKPGIKMYKAINPKLSKFEAEE